MTKEEFLKLKIGLIIINDKTGEIVKTTSQFSDDYKPKEKDDPSISINEVLLEGYSEWDFIHSRWGIQMSDCENWKIYKGLESVENRELKDKILMREIRILKAILYKTIRVDYQFSHLI